MILSPCKDCTRRQLACHGTCITYNEWKNNNKKQPSTYVTGHVFGRSDYYSSKHARKYAGKQT